MFEYSRLHWQQSEKKLLLIPLLSLYTAILIHVANPQSRPVVITIFRRGCPSIPTFQILLKENNYQVTIVIATGGTVDLAEWIILVYMSC